MMPFSVFCSPVVVVVVVVVVVAVATAAVAVVVVAAVAAVAVVGRRRRDHGGHVANFVVIQVILGPRRFNFISTLISFLEHT
jgi:hypothetical protein